ncbi:MAG TPA: hypothetical protein VFV66_04670 [Nonomuraea sp.]|nr:hypothetical protein [Nonomuraea sp.]
MLVKRLVAGLTAMVTAVLGLNLATAGPATAASGVWRAYGNTNPITSSPSTWACWWSVPFDVDMVAQVCTVRSADGRSAQGAVIVRNNRSVRFVATATMHVNDVNGARIGDWSCPYSGVAAHSWSVCFGQTFTKSSLVSTAATVNTIYDLGESPLI